MNKVYIQLEVLRKDYNFSRGPTVIDILFKEAEKDKELARLLDYIENQMLRAKIKFSSPGHTFGRSLNWWLIHKYLEDERKDPRLTYAKNRQQIMKALALLTKKMRNYDKLGAVPVEINEGAVEFIKKMIEKKMEVYIFSDYLNLTGQRLFARHFLNKKFGFDVGKIITFKQIDFYARNLEHCFGNCPRETYVVTTDAILVDVLRGKGFSTYYWKGK